MEDSRLLIADVDRRAWLCATLAALAVWPAEARTADASPQARAQRFLAAVGAERFEEAARAFFYVVPPEPERVAALAHHLQALQHDVGDLQTARPIRERPTGAPKRFLQIEEEAPDASAKARVRPTLLAYELDSASKGTVRLLLTMVGTRGQWRVRSLGAYWAGDR